MSMEDCTRSRVLFLIPTLDDGGAERVASTLSLRLGDQVDLFLQLHDARRVSYPYKGVIYGMDAPSGRTGPFQVIRNQIRRIRKIRKFKAEHRITVAVSFFEPSNLYNRLTRGSERVILTVHNYKSAEARGSASFRGRLAEWMYRPLIRWLYPGADRVVAVSRGVARDLADHFGIPEDKLQVIPNAIPVRSIRSMALEPLPEKHARFFEGPVLIHAGRLCPQKGHAHLFHAFRLIREVYPDISLVLLGSGPLESCLQQQVREMGLEQQIHFLGFQKNPFQYIARADVFVFPSLYEGFGMALLEAMACGVPVVSADCRSGPREILAPDTDPLMQTGRVEYARYGVLVPLGTPGKKTAAGIPGPGFGPALAEAVLRLLGNRLLASRYSELALQRAQEYDDEKILPQWEALLHAGGK